MHQLSRLPLDSFPPHKLVTNFGRLAEELGIDEAAAFIEATLEDEEATDEAHSRFGWGFMTSHKSEKISFDAESLRLLEEVFDSTWAIVQARHPFRDLEKDPDLQNDLRRKLFMLAENCGLSNLDQLQRSALEAFSV